MVREAFKQCNNCKRTFPNTTIYFKNRNICRECEREIKNNSVYDSLEATLKKRFRDARTRARLKKIEFTITEKDLLEILKDNGNKCWYTGIELEPGIKGDHTISIDRLDSSKGYTKDNICLCLWKINKMKSDTPLELFLQSCREVSEWRKIEFKEQI